MAQMTSLMDGFLEELRDLYSAENQLLKVLPKIEAKASDRKLKKALSKHIEETKKQVDRLNEIAGILNVKLTGKSCKAMKGIIEEGSEVLEKQSENKALLDVLLIGAAQRVEHYEMAAYLTTIEIAREIGQEEVANLLEMTLAEEEAASQILLTICLDGVLSSANTENSAKKSGSTKGSIRGAAASVAIGILLSTSMMYFSASAETQSDRMKNEKEAVEYKADDTGRNVRDNNSTRKTADDQNLIDNTTQTLARIRREIVANGSLSTNAHNVKIIVENGQVLLRGPVNSPTEKKWIGETAGKIASNLTVVNELEVLPG